MTLPPGSTLSVDATRVDLLSSIKDAGGALAFQNVVNVVSNNPGSSERPGVFIGDGVTLDVRGQWTNDWLNPNVASATQTWQNGGSITLGLGSIGSLLSIGNDVDLRASGGAWINSRGTLTAGTGGSISLNANATNAGFDMGGGLALDGFGVNGAGGGQFSLTAPRIEISAGSGWAGAQQVDDFLAPGNVLQLHPGLFSNYGFETVDLTASGLVAPGAPTTNVLTVDSGITIDATVSSLVLNPNPAVRPSASTLDGLATVSLLAPYLRPAASVDFAALPPKGSSSPNQGVPVAGDVFIGAGASIATDPGGAITLTSLNSILMNGTLRALGGDITLQVVPPTGAYVSYESGFLPNQRIELGSFSVIDVSGTFVSKPSSVGLELGTASAGGAVSLLAGRGTVAADVGSYISVAGTTATVDAPQANGTYARELAATAGGSLSVESGQAISLLGNIAAAAGSGGTTGAAASGSLDIALTRSESWWGNPPPGLPNPFSTAPLTMEILPSAAGLPASLATSNQAVLGAAQLAQWGFDALRLEAGNQVEFSGPVSLESRTPACD